MPAQFQPSVLWFDTIDSTNLEAIRRARAGADEGLCIVAREQSAGRGRLDRTWHSPKDAGLYCSILLRPKFETGKWPLLSLVSALAVADALAKCCSLIADIKWPNDLCVNDRKLCGILAETIDTRTGPAVVVGIGINLRQDSLPVNLSGQATSIEELTAERPDAERLLAELIEMIGTRYHALHDDGGFERTIRDWCAKSSYASGREVRVSLNHDSFVGVTRGLESDGALRVETGDGQIRRVRAGDVTALRPLGHI